MTHPPGGGATNCPPLPGLDRHPEAIDADIAEQFEAGRDEAYSPIAGEDAFSASRSAGQESQIEPSNSTIADDDVPAEASVISLGHAATRQLLATENGVLAAEDVVPKRAQSSLERWHPEQAAPAESQWSFQRKRPNKSNKSQQSPNPPRVNGR